MEECNIGQKPQLSRKVSSNVSMVKINASDNAQFGIVKGWSAKDPIISTHIGTCPIACGIQRVRIDSMFQCVERNISSSEPFIGESHVKADLKIEVVGKIFFAPERQELAARNEGRFSI